MSGQSATNSSELARQVERFARYLSLERGRSENTLKAYRGDLETYLSWLHHRGVDNPQAVTSEIVEDFSLSLDGSSRSIQRRLSAVRSFHRFLVEDGVVTSDPTAQLSGPAQPDRLPKALGVSQVQNLLESVSGDDTISLRDRALLEVLYATGARVSEVTGLAVDDVFGSNGRPAELLRVLGKGNKERLVPLGRHAQTALEAYVVRARPVLVAKAKRASAALFLGARGGALSRQNVWLILRARAEAAHLSEPLSPHTLRHSCATHLLQGGADIRVVQELLGHSSVQTTQIYTKVTIDTLKDTFFAAHPRATG
jgi:integrase/recombinase XerD